MFYLHDYLIFGFTVCSLFIVSMKYISQQIRSDTVCNQNPLMLCRMSSLIQLCMFLHLLITEEIHIYCELDLILEV